jgi:hypothetical protein
MDPSTYIAVPSDETQKTNETGSQHGSGSDLSRDTQGTASTDEHLFSWPNLFSG